jgi:predicted nuclease of predicted toxin-antitoxin system
VTVKLLIDECLHTSLLEVAHAAGHLADHVNYLGLGSSKDWQLMATIRAQDYTFVTNNRSDFLVLHGQEPLHAGVVIIVPNVTPVCQRELFTAALKHIGTRDLTNTVVEVQYARNQIECSEYALPKIGE